MAVELANMSMPMAALLASLIGAAATLTASFLNIRANLKKELLARAQLKPASKKSGGAQMGLLVAAMMLAAAGGFALSQQWASRERESTQALEAELRAKIEQLTESTQRLEMASLNSMTAIAEQVRQEERRKRGMDGVVAAVMLEKCTATDIAGLPACDESTARPIRLCTEVPFDAQVGTVALYARLEGDVRPWSESRVVAGQNFGGGRFTERVTESIVDGNTKHVCQELLFWNSERSLDARMIVHYDFQS